MTLIIEDSIDIEFFLLSCVQLNKKIEDESGVSRNTVSNFIDQLVELKILVPDSSYVKLAYKYNEIYNSFYGVVCLYVIESNW